MGEIKYMPAGDRALVVEFGNRSILRSMTKYMRWQRELQKLGFRVYRKWYQRFVL